MDTNPFATNDPTAQQAAQGGTPSYLQQQPNNPTAAGAVSNMVKALMQGNNQFKQGQQLQQMIAQRAQNPAIGNAAAAMGPTPGAPMNIQSPAQMAAMGAPPSGAAAAAPTAQSPPMMTPPQGAAMGAGAGAAPDMSGGGSPFTTGTTPQSVDPMTQALFSQIPGADMSAMGGGLGSY